MKYVIEKDDHFILRVKVQPRAKKSEIVGVQDDRLKVRLKAPPVDGKANAELVRFLSTLLDVSKSKVEIVSGQTSRLKTVKILGNSSIFYIHISKKIV